MIKSTIIKQEHQSLHRKLESESIKSDSSSNTDISDALSKHLKWVIAELIDYKTLNDFWIKDNQDFVNRANWIQIESNTSQTVKQAKVSFNWEKWKLAFRSKLNAHIKNNIFILKISSSSQWILSTRWVTIIKRELKEKMIKYKAKWMCKRFHQKQEIDYDEIFISMIRVIIIKMLLALTIKYDYKVEQMNVIIVFLETHLKEEIWMQQSLRFEQKESNEIFFICCLNKTLYELKQTS